MIGPVQRTLNFRFPDHPFRAPTLAGSPLMVSRNCSRKPARLAIHDHAVEKLDTARVSGIGDLMRDIAGERAGAVIPAFFLFRVRL